MNSNGPGPVPERWLHCPRKSQTLIAGKFLAFKTPLGDRFDEQVPPQCRFPPSMIFESMKNYRVKIGLWIDLTNTSRFYSKDEVVDGYHDFETQVAYMKVNCRGHEEAPSPDQTRTFINTCKNFISRHPLEIIGVHCTHGFNRTGFLIVSYLVEEMDWSLEAALKEFTDSRPPGIYKQGYILELFKRYDEEENCIAAPALPSWCFENDTNHDDDDNSESTSSSNSHDKKRKHKDHRRGNHVKRSKHSDKVPEFMEGVPGVTTVLDPNIITFVQRTAEDICGYNKRGFPGCQPVSMGRENIMLLHEKAYRVSWKADGSRYMMLILGENRVYFLDRDNNVFLVSGLRFVNRKDFTKHLTTTLVDGEMVIDKHEGMDIPRYLVYDVIMVDSKDVKQYNFFPERLLIIEADIINPRNKAIAQGIIDKRTEPFSVRAKAFFPIDKASSFLSEKFCQQLTHEPDGLIFQPSKEPYVSGRCMEVLKWKPHTHNSVDFKLKIVKEEGMGIVPRKIGHLFVGGSDVPFGTIKISSALREMDGKIVECTWNEGWVFMRERTDKSFPNSYTTAVSVCDSIKYPITKEYLFQIIDEAKYKGDFDRELMPPPPNFRR